MSHAQTRYRDCRWFINIHIQYPILGIPTMGILNPINGCITVPFYGKTNYALTMAQMIMARMDSEDGCTCMCACVYDFK